MKKRIFALALALCMMLAAAPAVLASGVLTLGNGNVSTTLVEDQTSVQTPVRATARTTARNFTPIDHTSVETTKVVTPNDDGTYTITLESWVTGSSVTTSTTASEPTDIVLVLDYSASMSSDMDNLRSSVRQFIDTVAEKSTQGNEHRIALVTFGRAKSSDYTNTELYIGKGSAGADTYGFESYQNLSEAHYQSAFISASNATQVGNMKDALRKYCNGETAVDLGLDMAENVLLKNPLVNGEDRSRVVVVFTDGEPTHSGNGYDETVAATSINIANRIKNSGAKVYSVGLFDNADETVEPTDNFNTFLHKISSNETYPQTPSYYYALKNSSKLSEIFSSIASNVTTGGAGNTTLNSETVLQDVVTEYFEIPSNPSAVKAHTESISKNGQTWTSDNNSLAVNIDGNKVSVTGFDYVANWVGPRTVNGTSTYSGKKVVLEILIKPKAGFLGGENVPTNVPEQSGLYKGEEWAEQFPNNDAKATVDIPSVTIVAQDKNVYLLGSLTEVQMLDQASVSVGDESLVLDQSQANYGLEAWQNKFVDISVSASANAAFNGTADSNYSVSCTVNYKGTTGTPVTDEAAINVFKPTLTYPDYTVYLGNDPIIAPTSTVWKHGDTVAPASMGDAPTLTGHTYSWLSGTTTCNEAVVLTDVKIGDVGVKDYIIANTFKVHVLTPTVQGTDKTIYLSNKVGTLSAKVSGWNKCSHTDAPAVTGTAPAPSFTYTGVTADDIPDKCTSGTAVLSKIGNVVLSGTEYADEFDIHVLKPTVTGKDDTIKLGVEAPMAAESKWATTCGCAGELPTVSGSNHSVEYVYSKDNTNKYPVECTDYTVTAKIGDKIYSDIKDIFTIHVETPTIEGVDKTIYRGNTATAEAKVVKWSPCNHKDVSRSDDEDPEPTFSFSDGERVSPEKCKEYTVTLTELGDLKLKGTKHEGEIFDNFWVHVLQPTISAEDATIYYGSSIDLDGEDSLSGVMKDVSWGGCTHDNVPAVGGAEPTPEYSFNIGVNDNKDTYSPENCTPLTATWTLDGENFTDGFTVHVAKPIFKTTDITIYRGNETNLNHRVSVDTEWKCDGGNHIVQTLPAVGAPAITYAFEDSAAVADPKKYAPTECTSVVTKPTVGNKTWADLTAFNVHVLQPTFTVATQNIWADYTDEVDLATYGIASYQLVWKDIATGHSTPSTLPEGAPVESSVAYTFDKGTNGKYTVGTTDETVTATKLSFVLYNDYSADYTLEGKTFTVHVNKFDLTIEKTWDGAAVYKQDAIFTVYGGLGDFKVVLPADQSSITVTGLLCGQEYTVSEDDAWTWRWTSDGAETVAADSTKHEVTTSDPHSDMTDDKHVEEVSFSNKLIKELWFSFCTFVRNIFGSAAIQKGGN